MSCLDILNKLVDTITEANTEITANMINTSVKYEDVCIRPNITFDKYSSTIKEKWEKDINNFINKPDKCPSSMQSLLFVYEIINKLNDKSAARLDLSELSDEQVKKMVSDKIIDTALNMLKNKDENKFVFDNDIVKTLKNLAYVLSDNCQCQILEIFSFVMQKYKSRYAKKLEGKSREESIKIIKEDHEYIKSLIDSFGKGSSSGGKIQLNFSIEQELEKLIPNELGTLKKFFIKVTVKYFNNLHPIIWGQVFKGLVNNLFNDLPITPDEFFSFVSKYVLLNSGPFILKMLQMIRPILSDELAKKYNLTKLTYPLLEKNQVDLVLRNILIDYDMTKIIYNKSASVGHVCIGYNTKNPENKFVIKIIKPLAIAQSCWEYSVLSDLFPKDSCEDQFIKNTLRSNGAEMNVANEIKNLNRSYSAYTQDYNTEFGIDVDAKVTTIQHLPGIVKEGTWFALAMTLAPGTPLSDLVESKVLEKDTKFRANLHRCLDVLVSRFFYTLVNSGFYHGDLHAGNIFYSYKNKQITMIDFGAMGDIDLFNNDETTIKLIEIIVMSINYDFDNMFDTITDILNSKCKEDSSSMVNKDTQEYKDFKKKLLEHKLKNIMIFEKEKEKYQKYISDVSGSARINEELSKTNPLTLIQDTQKEGEFSIYDPLDFVPEPKETVIENTDILPQFTDISETSESISFAQIMEMIIKFYATSGINIAIKFAELNELQKAYALLLGVLAKTGYSSYRMSNAIRTGILNWGHLPKLLNVSTTYKVVSSYWDKTSQFRKMADFVKKQKELYLTKKK